MCRHLYLLLHTFIQDKTSNLYIWGMEPISLQLVQGNSPILLCSISVVQNLLYQTWLDRLLSYSNSTQARKRNRADHTRMTSQTTVFFAPSSFPSFCNIASRTTRHRSRMEPSVGPDVGKLEYFKINHQGWSAMNSWTALYPSKLRLHL